MRGSGTRVRGGPPRRHPAESRRQPHSLPLPPSLRRASPWRELPGMPPARACAPWSPARPAAGGGACVGGSLVRRAEGRVGGAGPAGGIAGVPWGGWMEWLRGAGVGGDGRVVPRVDPPSPLPRCVATLVGGGTLLSAQAGARSTPHSFPAPAADAPGTIPVHGPPYGGPAGLGCRGRTSGLLPAAQPGPPPERGSQTRPARHGTARRV